MGINGLMFRFLIYLWFATGDLVVFLHQFGGTVLSGVLGGGLFHFLGVHFWKNAFIIRYTIPFVYCHIVPRLIALLMVEGTTGTKGMVIDVIVADISTGRDKLAMVYYFTLEVINIHNSKLKSLDKLMIGFKKKNL